MTNTRDVVMAIQRLLINQLSDIFPEETIVVSDPDNWEDGKAPENLMQSQFLTVCPGDSTFPDDVQIGGGANTTEELGTVEIHIFSDARLDQVGQMPAAVYDESEGLFELKRRVLRALCQADPTGDNQMPLVSQLIPAISATKPRRNAEGIHFIKLTFGASYFWDLS